MLITKKVQDAYRGELGRLESAAADYVESYLEAIRKAAPNASVAEVREAAKAAIEDSLNIFGDQAGALACELFDETMAREGIVAQAQLYSDTIDLDMMDEKVRYYARDLLNDDGPSFVGKVTDLTRFYVKRSAYENMVRNCSSHLVRYARVPSGRETCSFCFMLASRGFVYHSEQTAEGRGLHGVHDHCDCIIVPGVPGETEIDGYDPEAMERRWRQCAETIGVDPDDAYRLANRKTVMKEVETRDWRWLYEGKTPEIRYADDKWKREIKKNRPHEIESAERLLSIGIRGDLWRDYIEYRDAETGQTYRIGLPDLSNGYEIKTLVDAKGINAVDKALRDAGHKEGLKCCFIDNSHGVLPDNDVEKAVREKMGKRNVSECLIRFSTGKYLRIKLPPKP